MHEYVQDADRAKILAEVERWAHERLETWAETDVLTFWVADGFAYLDPNYDNHPMSTFDVQTPEQFDAAMRRVITIEEIRDCDCRECAA